MADSPLTAALTEQFHDVPPSLVAVTVEAAAAVRGPGTDVDAVERIARTDVAALDEALRRASLASQ